jgi:predicted SAM-dependent methyltransferase
MNLHIGGTTPKDGWRILNVQPGSHVDFQGDLRDLTQFAEGSVDQVYASHVLEHVGQADVAPALRGLHRILRPGGTVFLSVPDLDVLCHLFINPLATAEIKWHAMRMIFGGQVDPHDYHYVGLNEQFLRRLLTEAGFSGIRRVASLGLFQDASEFRPYGFPISLNMIAAK